jgi:hypothetical protein
MLRFAKDTGKQNGPASAINITRAVMVAVLGVSNL